MSHHLSGRRVTAIFAFCSLLVLCSLCHGQDAASVEKIWRERSARIKEIHLKWVERLTHYTVPGVTAEGEGEFALSVDGRIRLLSDNFPDGASPSAPRRQNIESVGGKLILPRQIHVYDGVTYAALYGPQPGKPYHVLGVGSGVVPNWDFVANISALEMFCRPFDKRANALRDGLSGFQSRIEQLDGEKVVAIEKEGLTLWVTNDERALVLRRVRKKGDLPRSEIRARYAKDPDTGEWLPAGWDYKSFGVDGEFIVESRTAEVTEAYVHAPLPVELFRLEKVPEGAWVNQHRDGKATDYIHRSKRGPRYILPGEFTGDNYEALLNSDTPETKPSSSTK